MLTRGGPEYPAALLDLPDPPDTVWSRGDVSAGPALAIVGTRQPDHWGRAAARASARAAVAAGASVVSGLAPGIDAAAHRGAIEAGGHTLGIPPYGVNLPPASENADLAEAIVAAGGALLAEVPPGTAATPATRISRDRLQAVMAIAVVVVAAGDPCGTLHTARFAIALGRTLAVLAPPRLDGPYAGSAALIDPRGCDPGLLGATGDLAQLIRGRRPVADVVLAGPAEVAYLLGR